MSAGIEYVIDADGCSAEALATMAAVRSLLEDVIVRLELRVVGAPMWHKFPGAGGVTGIYLLSESHLACHTYPERGVATVNLYCCRPRAAYPWEHELRARTSATRVIVREITRGEST